MAGKMFSNIRIVELGDFISAPFCTKMMADWGAEVIKVEPPGCGDSARRQGPFSGNEPDSEKSGLYLYLNCNKKSVTLNLQEPSGQKVLKQILKDADVLVENYPVGTMKKWGLDYESLKLEFPKLIMISISPFGQTGPYCDFKGYALNASALSGMAMSEGSWEREPIDHPMSFCDYAGGQGAALALLIAVFARNKTGKGQYCDVAAFQYIHGYQGAKPTYNWVVNKVKQPRAGEHGVMMFYPAAIFKCKDGDFCMYSIDFGHWQRLIKEVLGFPEWAKKNPEKYIPDNGHLMSMVPIHEEVDKLVTAELMKYTKAELFERARKAKVPFYPVMDMKDMLESPQTKYREMVVELEHPVAGKLKYPGQTAVLSETPFKLETPAPLLGQHNEEIFCGKLGYSKAEILEFNRVGII